MPRLLDMGVEGYLAASTVNVVVAQRLVRKICSACTIEYKPDNAIMSKLSDDFKVNLSEQKFYRGKGCPECGNKGFSGRIGIYEVLQVTETIRPLISSRVSSDEILEQAKKEGMVTMLQDGLNKVSGGLTTIEEVIKAVLEN